MVQDVLARRSPREDHEVQSRVRHPSPSELRFHTKPALKNAPKCTRESTIESHFNNYHAERSRLQDEISQVDGSFEDPLDGDTSKTRRGRRGISLESALETEPSEEVAARVGGAGESR